MIVSINIGALLFVIKLCFCLLVYQHIATGEMGREGSPVSGARRHDEVSLR